MLPQHTEHHGGLCKATLIPLGFSFGDLDFNLFFYVSQQTSLKSQLINILVNDMVSVREGNGTSLQYSCLENPMDGEAWWAAVQGVARSRTWLSDFTFTFHFHALEKEMATHSSVLAWRIPGTGEAGGLPSMGSHRVGHDWSDLAAAAAVSRQNSDKLEEARCGNRHTCYFPDLELSEFLESKVAWGNHLVMPPGG